MPAADDRAGSPTSRCAESRTSGPAMDARGEAHGRRLRRPRDPEHGEERDGRCDCQHAAAAAELAAVLRVREAQDVAAPPVRPPARPATSRRRTTAPPAPVPRCRRGGRTASSSTARRGPSARRASPAGTAAAGARPRRRTRGRRRSSGRRPGAATTRGARRRARTRRGRGGPRQRAATGGGRSACTTRLHPCEEPPRRVLHARERVRGRVRPLSVDARDRERPPSVGERRHGRVGREHEPAALGL